MDKHILPFAWKRYLRSCHSLGYDPELSLELSLTKRYNKLYTKYCIDNDFHVDESKDLDADANVTKLSIALYFDLCEELGYESIIKIRRTVSELKDRVSHIADAHKPYVLYHLGSRAEGLRMKTSDVDMMTVFRNNIILNDTTNIPQQEFTDSNKTIMVLETESTKPGYVRLRVLKDAHKRDRISTSYCTNEHKMYLSSKLFREFNISSLGIHARMHGPCTTTFHGNLERDIADCIACTTQPTSLNDWKIRCKKYNWPPTNILDDCVSLGCQLAPIGAKGSSREDLEWRISFILIEKKLVHSMNHCQFLCYGMLKIYLNEVLNQYEEINDLISSYFMKTLIFWEIQMNNVETWTSETMLQNFFRCLDRMRAWVSNKNWPNFFIPENNMFEHKINESSRQKLLEILELLFNEKVYGLYKCHSIDLPYLIFQVMINERQSVTMSLQKNVYVSSDEIEKNTWHEINAEMYAFLWKQNSHSDLVRLHQALKSIEDREDLTELEKITVQAWISEVKVYFVSHRFKEMIDPGNGLEQASEIYNSCCNTLRENNHKGSVALLYMATAMYVTGRYESCLEVIRESNKILKEGYLQVVLLTTHLQLKELRLELELTNSRNQYGIDSSYLHIDPSLYVSMLSVLSHYNLGDVEGTEIEFQILREIRSDMPYMRIISFQEISWQILGICAEIIGKYSEAYSSYINAFKSQRFFLQDNAPLFRILCMLYKLRQLKFKNKKFIL